ncbi:hypothetical protein PT974_11756 [Cladobotryum mycophilum]|uniref:Uncharacterized protein n=1 Tax=Cladobotryum mycophilum TaxID=491253 RepID=A0ABR0S624_9HYPO
MSTSPVFFQRPKPRPVMPLNGLHPFQQHCMDAKKQPFLDYQHMVGDSECARENFRHPLLRRFCLEGKIEWKQRLGQGLDGVVWRVNIQDCEFAIKVFWDNEIPEGTRYWAAQMECHNAALIQMMQTAVKKSDEPIYLRPEPTTYKHAVANLHAFSDEGRQKQYFRKLPNAVQYTTLPRLRQCFGWTKVSGRELQSLSAELRPIRAVLDRTVRDISPREEYYAIVYEFIPETGPEQEGVDAEQSQLDFFG